MKYRSIRYPLIVLAIALGICMIIGIVSFLHESLQYLGWFIIAVILYSMVIIPISFVVGLVLDLIKGLREQSDDNPNEK